MSGVFRGNRDLKIPLTPVSKEGGPFDMTLGRLQ